MIKLPGRNFDSSIKIFFLTILIQFSAIELINVTLNFWVNLIGRIIDPVHGGHIGIIACQTIKRFHPPTPFVWNFEHNKSLLVYNILKVQLIPPDAF